MVKKSESGKTQTRRRAAPGKTTESKSQPTTMKDFGAAVEVAQRHAEDVQAHASDALKTAVKDIQKRQKKLKDDVAAIGKKSTMSAEAKVAATHKALNDFDAFLARVAAGIDRQRTSAKPGTTRRGATKRAASEKAKTATKGANPRAKKPAKVAASSGPGTQSAATTTTKAASSRKPAAKRSPRPTTPKPAKS